jgi:hypothetical protein
MSLIEKEIQSGFYNPAEIYLTHALDLREIYLDPIRQGEIPGESIIESLDFHIRFNPKDPVGYYYKGNTLTRMGLGTEGLEQMEISYGLDTLNISTQLDLMELYLLNNRFEVCEKFYFRITDNEGFKTGSTHTQRDKAIIYYLMISALRVQDKEYDQYLKELNKFFKKEVEINFWSYDSYLDWLGSCNCNSRTKLFLRDLTGQMKSYDKSGL